MTMMATAADYAFPPKTIAIGDEEETTDTDVPDDQRPPRAIRMLEGLATEAATAGTVTNREDKQRNRRRSNSNDGGSVVSLGTAVEHSGHSSNNRFLGDSSEPRKQQRRRRRSNDDNSTDDQSHHSNRMLMGLDEEILKTQEALSMLKAPRTPRRTASSPEPFRRDLHSQSPIRGDNVSPTRKERRSTMSNVPRSSTSMGMQQTAKQKKKKSTSPSPAESVHGMARPMSPKRERGKVRLDIPKSPSDEPRPTMSASLSPRRRNTQTQPRRRSADEPSPQTVMHDAQKMFEGGDQGNYGHNSYPASYSGDADLRSYGSASMPSLQGSIVSYSSRSSHEASTNGYPNHRSQVQPNPRINRPLPQQEEPEYEYEEEEGPIDNMSRVFSENAIDNMSRLGEEDSFAADSCWDNGTFKSFGSNRKSQHTRRSQHTRGTRPSDEDDDKWELSTFNSGATPDFRLPRKNKLSTFDEDDEDEGFGRVKQNTEFVKKNRGRRDPYDRDRSGKRERRSSTESQDSTDSGESGDKSSLFVFRRKNKEGKVECETTLPSKDPEETMADLVRQLQGHRAQANNGGILNFPKREVSALKTGERRIVFVLKQVRGAKFGKDEFGTMRANEVLMLTKQRPVIVDIRTESCVVGETVEIF